MGPVRETGKALHIVRAVPRPALFLLLAIAVLPACGWRSEPVAERAERYPVEVQDARAPS